MSFYAHFGFYVNSVAGFVFYINILVHANMFGVRLANLAVGRSRAVFQFTRSLSAAATGSKEHIDGLVRSGQKVVVFMKGTPEAPRCGFSNAVIQILKMHGVDNFDAHNVLEDEHLRQGKNRKMAKGNKPSGGFLKF